MKSSEKKRKTIDARINPISISSAAYVTKNAELMKSEYRSFDTVLGMDSDRTMKYSAKTSTTMIAVSGIFAAAYCIMVSKYIGFNFRALNSHPHAHALNNLPSNRSLMTLTILKLGGSVLTEKTNVPTPKPDVIKRCALEIASATTPGDADNPLILVHGAGSFGHPQAEEHDSPDGFSNFGITEIHRTVVSLNELVIGALVESGIPAAPVHPLSCVVADDARIADISTAPIAMMLARGIVPVLHGDVVMDRRMGASIVSGDQLVTYLAAQFGAARIGFGTAVDGVIVDGATVPLITPKTFGGVRSQIHGSDGTDVTGGMLGKVLELLNIDMDSYIFDAIKDGMVARFLSGEELGTKIAKL